MSVETRTVSAEDDDIRLDRWFKRHYPDLSHIALQKLLRSGQVRLDGKRAEASDRVAAGQAVYVLRHGRQTKVTLRDLTLEEGGDHGQGGLVRAPMHGKVLSILVEPGAGVARGQHLVIIEAMKMEHTLTAPIEGIVAEIAVAIGAQVAEGAKMLVIEPANPAPKG